MKINFYIILIAIVLLLSSCASLYTGTHAIVHINSMPQNAKVFLNEKYVGNTPISLKVAKSLSPERIKLQRDGFVDTCFKLEKKFAPISLLSYFNIWIDVVTGAILKHSKNYYHIELSKNDKSIDTSRVIRSGFYYIKYTGDTVFTAPFYDFKLKGITSNIDKINYQTVSGKNETIGASYIKKIKSLNINRTYIGFLLLTAMTKIDYVYVTYLNVPYYQNENVIRSVLMQELLENGKFHLLKSYFDDNSINQKGDFKSSLDPIYYLYEDGGKLTRIGYRNLLNCLLTNFKNEKDLILAIKSDCTFKNLEEYIYKNRDVRNAISSQNK